MLTEFQLFQDFPLPPPAVIQPATRTLSRLRVSILYILLYVERERVREREKDLYHESNLCNVPALLKGRKEPSILRCLRVREV